MNTGNILKGLLGVLLILSVVLVVCCDSSEPAPAPEPTPEPEPAPAPPDEPQDDIAQGKAPEVKLMQWDSPPKMEIDKNKKYTAIMETVKGKLLPHWECC